MEHPAEAALLIDLAELLFQFRDLLLRASDELFVNHPARQLPVLHHLHFEFRAIVFF